MSLGRQWARAKRVPARLWTLVHLKITDVVYVLDLADYRQAPVVKAGFDLRALIPGDEAALTDAFGAAKSTELTRRLETCFGVVAFKGGKAVAYSWMTDQPRSGEGEAPFFYDVAPKPGWFYFFDTYVKPEARGAGLATLLKRLLIEEARRRSGKQCVATHDEGNLAVIHVSERLGFKLFGKMTYRRILGIASKDLSGLPEGVRA